MYKRLIDSGEDMKTNSYHEHSRLEKGIQQQVHERNESVTDIILFTYMPRFEGQKIVHTVQSNSV